MLDVLSGFYFMGLGCVVMISLFGSMLAIDCKFRRLYAYCLVMLSRLVFVGWRGKVGDDALKVLLHGCSDDDQVSLCDLKPVAKQDKPHVARRRHRSRQFTSLSISSTSDISLSSSPKKALSEITESVLSEVSRCAQSIVEDSVTQRFVAEDLANWNLLRRTGGLDDGKNKWNWKVLGFYAVGFIFRYLFMLPARLLLCLTGLFLMFLFSMLMEFKVLPRDRHTKISCAMICMRMFARSMGTILNFHNVENRPKDGGICVANHTTVLDIIVLMSDRTFSMIGQEHPGLIGWFQKTVNNFMTNIWFDRGDQHDREHVSDAMTAHVQRKDKLDPILIFPEGTCINNTSVMMFKKGSFEIDATFHPVAIKYNPYFGDAFWNSSKFSMVHYLIQIFSGWCIVADIYYLPAVRKGQNETALHFANRVKQDIADRGGLVDMAWDGGLKRAFVKPTAIKKEQAQLARRSTIKKLQVCVETPSGDAPEEDIFS